MAELCEKVDEQSLHEYEPEPALGGLPLLHHHRGVEEGRAASVAGEEAVLVAVLEAVGDPAAVLVQDEEVTAAIQDGADVESLLAGGT